MLDFVPGVTEVPLSFQVGVLTSGGVPEDLSNCELGYSDFQDQMGHTISTSKTSRCASPTSSAKKTMVIY